ncbi:DHA3 family multidrug efflux protein-like MFS transporter [Naumannella cuiyingiana]|uniref:DHA3 family multidrug efflux protein-like MFS transporter n=1 Tax=Naumannella cuiyingiana TaxID=1347891 RepID=A0A7Z0D7T8_9ACTN|nr:MFS transporter [Naumannella cuiyingiana]NYI70393.1 DHA3 family multidrug efflux protein-like MFS transporter [Naumannella cuiyingiana]
MKSFYLVLVNTLLANVTSSYLWFALTFWIYLETRSVTATAMIGGTYMLLVALTGTLWGTIVDRVRKKTAMAASSTITLTSYLLAGLTFATVPTPALLDLRGPWFWIFAVLILIGGVVESMRNIALSTTVTLLVPEPERAKANGLVGSVQGLAFLVTSVFSGLSIGLLGMGPTLIIAIVATALALVQLLTVRIPEEGVLRDPEVADKRLDLAGSWRAVRAMPGLLALILFSTFNNLIGGVYMALLDPYGLTLFDVSVWGIVLAITSTGFIVGGLVISRTGLGANPIRTLLLVNLGVSAVGLFFAVRETWWLFVPGMFVFMMLIPAAEAAEQTIIQKVVPLQRQGRVFGFAQSVEAAAAPVSAFLIGPLAEFVLIPWVDSPAGRGAVGWLLGEGQARGMALIFMIAAVIMVGAVLVAFRSGAYRRLSAGYAQPVATSTAT